MAYAASIGGVGTVVGSPPNAIVISTVQRQLGITIGFVGWMVVGVPLVVAGLPIAWYLLTHWLYPPEVEDVVGAAASFGFALPVATPPNAIVFGTGRMHKDHMQRAGAVLDAVMAVVVTLVLLGTFRTAWRLVV